MLLLSPPGCRVFKEIEAMTEQAPSTFTYSRWQCGQRSLRGCGLRVMPQPAERKYRRQSVHLSAACREDAYTIRFNKSFDPSSIVYKAREGGIQSSVESLPNFANVSGQIEAMLCPYQSDNADVDFGDVFFFWEQIVNRI